MSGKDQQRPAGARASVAGEASEAGDGRTDPSRRALLRGAAGAGVAGVAASTLIGLPAAQALASPARSAASASGRGASAQQSAAKQSAAGQAAGGSEPATDVVVHVRDARSGEMDIFSGTSLTRLNDPDLARRLMRAIG